MLAREVAGAALGQLLRLRADEEQRPDEDQVRDRVQAERGRDAEVLDGQGRARRPDRAGEVERHRVERDRGRHLGLLDELRDHRLLRRRRERAHHAERDRVGDHDPVGARSRYASSPSPAESTTATDWVTSSSERRFQRSDAPPAQGASSRIGMNCEKLSTPSSSAECVCR